MSTNLGDYLYYRLVYDYLSKKISQFGMKLMDNFMTWASGIALLLVTLWILLQGYRILSGQSRGPLMATVLNMGRIAVIVSAATTMSLAGSGLHHLLTVDLDQEVHRLFTGNQGQTTSSAIDKNLAYTQLALATINGVKVVAGDDEMQSAKDRSLFIATFGTASPPMTAGAMLLVYQFSMALFIGLGPLFILCLIFEQTKSLFHRWLMYGIGTTFSMALLSVVSAIVLELTAKISVALWVSRGINSLLGTQTEGLTSIAMQQGGMGLLLSALIVSVPPMAAMFFQGTLGSALSYSVFQGPGGSPGLNGQPPGSYLPGRGGPQDAGLSEPERWERATAGLIGPGAGPGQSDAMKPQRSQYP